MKSSSRSAVYLGNIIVAVVALIVAVLVVFGVITEANVLAVVALALAFYSAFSGALARMNVTPEK